MTTVISEPAPLIDRGSAANDCARATTQSTANESDAREREDHPRPMHIFNVIR